MRPIACLVLLLSFLWTGPVQAQSLPESSSKRTTKPATNSPASLDGSFQNDGYRNPFFGFSCKVPYGWVDRTQDMGEDAPDAPQSRVLLAAFQRPPEAVGETINSAIVITAESASGFRGLKTAADYFGPVTEAATAQGFKVVNEPYEFLLGARRLAREDFSKDRGKLTMYQSSLVLLQKGRLVTFTFIGGSEDEVEELIENLRFTAQTGNKTGSGK